MKLILESNDLNEYLVSTFNMNINGFNEENVKFHVVVKFLGNYFISQVYDVGKVGTG
jgi:hypothetical protein